MNVTYPFTAEEFKRVTGKEAEQDDLDRTNCVMAGQTGHHSCGVCLHGQPVFMCQECFVKCSDKDFQRMFPQ